MRAVGHRESDAILGAMRQVALTGGRALSYADTASILAAGHYLLRRRSLTDLGTLPAVEPADLVAALKDRSLAEEAVKYLAIMAMVDGTLDHGKLKHVLEYSRALDIEAGSGVILSNPKETSECKRGTGSSDQVPKPNDSSEKSRAVGRVRKRHARARGSEKQMRYGER